MTNAHRFVAQSSRFLRVLRLLPLATTDHLSHSPRLSEGTDVIFSLLSITELNGLVLEPAFASFFRNWPGRHAAAPTQSGGRVCTTICSFPKEFANFKFRARVKHSKKPIFQWPACLPPFALFLTLPRDNWPVLVLPLFRLFFARLSHAGCSAVRAALFGSAATRRVLTAPRSRPAACRSGGRSSSPRSAAA